MCNNQLLEYVNKMQNEIIPMHLEEVEKEYQIKILLAVESGSRAWGFASPDSDWDVRFIYVHQPEWYLQIDKPRDVIEHMYDDGVDLSGWELKKALGLFKSCNPTLLEWLHSPIVYYKDMTFGNAMSELESMYFNPYKTLRHYHGIYINQLSRYLYKYGYSLKRFLYYLRGILACKWIEHHQNMPPVLFADLVEGTVTDDTIKGEIEEILYLKSQSKEHNEQPVNKLLVNYTDILEKHFSDIDALRIDKTGCCNDSKLLNQLLFKVVMRFNIIIGDGDLGENTDILFG